MLVFVIPLMSPKVSNSWERTTKLFERCIRSVCNQTILDYKVIVVCHEKPAINFNHPNIHYIEVNFPIPNLTIESKTLDRGRKTLEGLLASKSFSPSHVMFVDADDCVSKRLAEFVEENVQEKGWLISKGYLYKENSYYLYRVRKYFYNLCGTCNIIRYDLFNTESSNLKSTDFVMKYYGGHTFIRETLKSIGNHLQNLPFEGAIYTIGNGENYYNSEFSSVVDRRGVIKYLKTLSNYRPLTSKLQSQFSIYPIDPFE